MAITVEPIAAAAPPVEPTNSEVKVATSNEGASSTSSLPDELLQIPAIQALFSGAPPAFSASLKDFQKRPEAKLISENKDGLMKAGMGLYRSLGGDLGVIFNMLKLNGEQLKAADQAGKLLEVAPPFDVVNQQVAGSGESNPVLSAPDPVLSAPAPAGMAGNTPAAANQMNSPVRSPAPLPASSQKSLTNARVKNLGPSKPTGQGQLLQSILKSPI